MQWLNDTRLVVGDVDFVLAPDGIQAGRDVAAASGGFVLRKPRWMVERYEALTVENPRTIVELGIYDGGSTALLALLFDPERLVAVDLSPTPIPALDRFGAVHAHFGVDQADAGRLRELVGDGPLDLVVDDASHLLAPSVASFNALFPLLRAGGVYVIEDWSYRHLIDRTIADAIDADPSLRDELARRLAAGETAEATDQPLSRLVLELVLTAAYASEIVAEVVEVREGWCAIRRGEAALDAGFDIRDSYGKLGAGLLARDASA